MKIRILKLLSLWIPPILWAALIFKFSSGTVPVASPIYWQDFTIKKVGHMLLFGVLAILVYRGLIGHGVSHKKAAIWAIAFAFFYGMSDELHQMFSQGREARIRDIFVDGAGSFLAIYIIYNFTSRFPEKVRLFLLKFGIF
jgi:VanZ family protein